jgi:hypothetical protein
VEALLSEPVVRMVTARDQVDEPELRRIISDVRTRSREYGRLLRPDPSPTPCRGVGPGLPESDDACCPSGFAQLLVEAIAGAHRGVLEPR